MSKSDSVQPRTYRSPNQVLCEGGGDAGFLEALGRHYRLPGFEITCVSEDGDFSQKLGSLEVHVNSGLIQRVLLVADNDSLAQAKFAKRQNDLRRRKIFPIPNEPLKIRSGQPSTAILMLPGSNLDGNLETLLLGAIQASHPSLVSCAHVLRDCTLGKKADDWKKGDRDKMLLRAILCSNVKENPNCSLSRVWDYPLMNIAAPEYKWVADFMGSFFQ